MLLHHGSCHCGAVRFTIDAEITDRYTCDCSLCRRRGAVMTSVREDRLKITAGEDKLTLYQWNARVARHFFCSICGVYPFHKKRSMPDHYGVNLGCLEDVVAPDAPVRKAEGAGMTVVDPHPRPEWSGPRQG
jgi:hypothetical protein